MASLPCSVGNGFAVAHAHVPHRSRDDVAARRMSLSGFFFCADFRLTRGQRRSRRCPPYAMRRRVDNAEASGLRSDKTGRAKFRSSLPGLTRQSIVLRKKLCEERSEEHTSEL